ncbi:hypothetical protein WA158_000434 [Blastocystis sp. Blastoise]
MWRSLAYNKKTKKGKIFKIIQEHYLRDNISCNSQVCEFCNPPDAGTILLSATPYEMRYCIPDTNTLLHQMDLIEKPSPIFTDFIILQTVLSEVRHNNLALFNRLLSIIHTPDKRFTVFANEHLKDTYIDKLPGESMNDYNDRAIRVATKYFENHFQKYDISIWLLTNDRKCGEIAKEDGLTTYTVKQYIDKYIELYPELQDYYTNIQSDISMSEEEKKKEEKYPIHINKDCIYPNYLSQEDMDKGMKGMELYAGIYRANSNFWKEGIVTIYGKNGEETRVLIQGLPNINRAVDGDRVCIYIYPEEKWSAPSTVLADNETEDTNDTNISVPKNKNSIQVSGRIVGILKRNWGTYCGSIELKEGYQYIPGSYVFFIPVNKSIPKIRFKTRQYNEIIDKRIILSIDDWPSNSIFPLGHYQSTIGPIGDKEVESQVILLERRIPFLPFTKAVMDCLPPPNWKITADNAKGRVDLRDRLVCSIDPPGCKDIDDALHARKLPNGNYEIGVHIADVAYYIKSGTPLDIEAASRSTSTYLVNRRLDMLPKILTEKLCSIVGGEDRFAFSVVWEIDHHANIIKSDYFRSIIRSRRAMTYAQAQEILDTPNSTDILTEGLHILLDISKILKDNRLRKGALNLASPEVHFMLDSETQEPLNMAEYEHKETHSLVEEFMLLANCSVAKRITEVYRNIAILRRHPTPPPERFTNLTKVVKQAGYEFDTSSSLALEESLDKAIDPQDPYFNTLVRILTTRCMTQAVYFPAGEQTEDQFLHYGLAAPIYTHFTSPIRRYSDVMVHRLLAAAQNIAPLPREYMDKQWMHETCENMNLRHLNAQLAGRDSVQLYTYIYFNKRDETAVGICMKCWKNGIVVWIPKFGIEGPIHFTKGNKNSLMNLNDYIYDEEDLVLKNTKEPNHELRTFKPVKVHVYIKEQANYRKKMILELVDIDIYDKEDKNKDIDITTVQNNESKDKYNEKEKEEEARKQKETEQAILSSPAEIVENKDKKQNSTPKKRVIVDNHGNKGKKAKKMK